MNNLVLLQLMLLIAFTHNSLGFESSCECGIFTQSWETSHMALVYKTGTRAESQTDCPQSQDDECKDFCRSKVDITDRLLWSSFFEKTCRFFFANQRNVSDESKPRIKGCLQGYYRSCSHTWTPLGSPYRKVVTCHKPRVYKREVRNSVTTVDAQDSVTQLESQNVVHVDEDISPLLLDMTFIRAAVKAMGISGPYVDGIFRLIDQVDVRTLVDQMNLPWVADFLLKNNKKYAKELDAAKCFMEYLVYSVFNHRFKTTKRSSDELFSMDGSIEEILGSELGNSTLAWLSGSVFQDRLDEPVSETARANAEVQDVGMRIVKFYLKNYFGKLTGGAVRLRNNGDPESDPENMAVMVEQATKPFLLSVFGVVPGVPASGHAERRNWFVHAALENEISLKNLPQHSLPEEKFSPPKTGNFVYDFGNRVFSTFQRARDSTSGLYCVKQYFLNRMWDHYRGRLRVLFRSISTRD